MNKPKVECPADLDKNSVVMPGMSMEHLVALAIAEEIEKLQPPGSSLHDPTLPPPPISEDLLKDLSHT